MSKKNNSAVAEIQIPFCKVPDWTYFYHEGKKYIKVHKLTANVTFIGWDENLHCRHEFNKEVNYNACEADRGAFSRYTTFKGSQVVICKFDSINELKSRLSDIDLDDGGEDE